MVESTEPFPEFNARRLLFVISGSLSATQTPYWLQWLKLGYPDLQTRIVLTRGATRFVTLDAVSVISGQEAEVDAWPDGPVSDSPHVELATWPDTIIVFPSTFHFLSRYALALGDTPVQLALQCTSALVGLAPAVPPGGVASPGYRRHTATLRTLPNLVVEDPVPGLSVHTGRYDGHVPAPLPTLIKRLEERRCLLTETKSHAART